MRLKNRSVVDKRLAVVVGGGVAVGVEGQCAAADGGDFVLPVVSAVDGRAGVGGGAAKVADRIERPGYGARPAGDGIVAKNVPDAVSLTFSLVFSLLTPFLCVIRAKTSFFQEAIPQRMG